MSELSKLIAALSPDQLELVHLRLNKLNKKIGHTSQTQIIPQRRESNQFPLSFGQQRLWFIDQLEPDTSVYNIPVAVRLAGLLNVAALEQSLNEIVGRHEVLRTIFTAVNGSPVQALAPTLTIPLPVVDLQALPEGEQSAEVQRLATEEAQRPFDLANGPLLRVTLLRLGAEEHVLLETMHHIVTDGWSMGIFIRELSALYEAFSIGAPSPLPELPIQYADFAHWQRQWFTGEILEKQLSYWKDQLAEAPPLLELPTDFARPSVQTFRGNHYSVVIPQSLIKSLNDLSLREGVTLFATLLTALKILLFKWTKQRDIVVGTVIAGRDRPEIERHIGCFMNFLALRNQLNEQQEAAELLKQVGAKVLEAYSHQDCPFEKVVEALNPNRELSHNPIYNVALLLQNFPFKIPFNENLEASPLHLDTESSLLDLRLVVYESSEKVVLDCEYSTDLFEADTIEYLVDSYRATLEKLVEQPESKLSEFELSEELELKAKAAKARDQKQTIAIAATFTADLVEESLAFWMQELELPYLIKFAPYNQVFQQLLNPSSQLSQNQNGINVILVRFEDWQKYQDCKKEEAKLPENAGEKIAQNVQELVLALKSAAQRSATPHLVCLCPPSPAAIEDAKGAELFQQMEKLMASELASISGLYLVTTSQLSASYPVGDYYDPHGDELGHIPYTPTFFSALGTMIARQLHAIKRSYYKVIVLDCDQTLWKGVCGEDGAEGVEIDPARQALQEFMVAQQETGKLICLCSKNDEEDVWAVFEHHQSMPLRREHLVSWCLNWQPKSENLKTLAQELQLGLDSFIFVDDNPVECAEVRANCPEVLTIELPQDSHRFPEFLQHIWAFDQLKVTQEDQARTELYRQNFQREQMRQESLTFEEFLAGLGLQVDIGAIVPEQMPRVAQLTKRTNQFNLTTIRRSEGEIQKLCELEKLECLVVQVKDRFGDYGLVGVMMFESGADALIVETFLLSCRVLGRGVEHQMLAHLGNIARERGLSWVNVPYVPTQKNQPALDFLDSVGRRFKQQNGKGELFQFPTEQAAQVKFDITDVNDNQIAVNNNKQNLPQASRNSQHFSALFERIAIEMYAPEQILQVIESQKQQNRPELAVSFVAPRTPIEQLIADIWAQALKIEQVGIYDDFFELGGNSLEGAIAINKLQARMGIVLHVVAIFDAPTVAKLATYLSEHYPEAVAKFLDSGPATTKAKSEQKINATIIEQAHQIIGSSFPSPSFKQETETTKNKPTIFILSPPRSGSTLLQVILGGHPQLFAPPELYLLSFNTLAERKVALVGRNNWMGEGTIKAIMQIKDCTVEQAENLMQELENQNLTTKQFYHLLQQWLPHKTLVDKTPPYASNPEILKRAEFEFENPLYIHLLRHPYGTIRSLEEVRFDLFSSEKIPKEIEPTIREKAELVWLIYHQNILEFLKHIPAERQCRVKFEDLIKQPSNTVEMLCQFLGLDFEPGMLQFYKEKKQRITDGLHSMSRMIGDIRFNEHQSIDAKMADRWKQHYQVDFLVEETWKVAKSLGYEPINPVIEKREEGEI